MKILMLSWEYPPRIVGGISRVVHDLAQKLGEENNEVHVLTCWEQGTKEIDKDKNVFVHRVHTYDVSTFNFIEWVSHLNFALLEHAVKMINEFGTFDIIHAHDWIVAFAARVLKNSYSIPLVCTIHATESGRNWGIHNDTQRYISNVEWWLTYESWRVIVNSHYMKNEVENVFRLPEDKIRVIPNGVDLNKFKGYERDYSYRRNYVMDHEKMVFFVGRLVNEKGAHVLVDAMPKVLQNYNDVKFVIAGRGPQMDYLKVKVVSMNIEHKVYFTGYINDENLLRLYKCADIAVFPSLYEPFGIVALEGMVANIPVVVSDIGGLGEIVYHDFDGMKAYSGNANSLADCILDLLYNPVKAEEMKKRALEKVNRVYNWNIISKQTMDVYNEVVNDCKKSSWRTPDIKEMFDLGTGE
ncbi:MAG: glycosyltransferase family 4 protein [Clostridia bacterium]|nr:glycosyltransferase family 4 protein [Clostridia bacterium]